MITTASESRAFANAHLPDQMMRLLPGHSGCSVTLLKVGKTVLVEKRAVDPDYSPRLRRQIDKQRSWATQLPLPFVRIPRIIEDGDDRGHYFARMEYVYFQNCSDFFSIAGRSSLDRLGELLCRCIDFEISGSVIESISAEPLIDKLDSIVESLRYNNHLQLYSKRIAETRSLLSSRTHLELPLGQCHGDLTFSNIMLSSDGTSIALIDFLDSFLESPIVDLAKLQQDTRFCWTLQLLDDQVDRIRFKQSMAYLQRIISNHYAPLSWYTDNIDLIQTINLLRIAPYAKEQRIHDFIIKSLQSLSFTND